MLGLAFILAMFTAMIILAAANPRAALFLAIFFIPWGGLDVDVGLRVIVWQLILAPLCLVTALRLTQPGWSPPRLACAALLLAMVLHAVIWSLLQVGFLPAVASGDSVLRGPTARAVIQVLLYLFALSPVVLVPWLLRGSADAQRALRLYLASLVVLAGLGWVQLGIWYGLGFNPMPTGAFNVALGGPAALLHEGLFDFSAIRIYRMNSLAGEPRNLATALTLGLLFIQAIALAGKARPGWKLGAIWLFLLISMIATFSTSGALIWPVASAALLPAMWLAGVRIQRSRAAIGIGLAAIVLPVLIGIGAAELNGIPVLDLLAERTLDRITADGAVEDYDLAITDYLDAHPAAAVSGLGLGNAHLYATPYLDPLFALYAEGTVFTGKTGIVKFVSEVGLIGFALFLGWYLALVWQTRAAVGRDPVLAPAVPMALMALAVFMNTNQVAAEIWTMGGMMGLLVATQRRPASAAPSATAQSCLVPA